MSETADFDEEHARQIIRNWLTAQNRSLRNLAQEAGIQPSVISRFLKRETTLEVSSALKVYSVMQQSLNSLERTSFLEGMGLLPIVAALNRNSLLTVDRNAPTHEAGRRLLVAGLEVYHQAAYEAALSVYRAAEEALGDWSSQAAFAACQMAQIFLNLGDLQKAEAEAVRADTGYAAVMDPETKAEYYRIRGWIAYHQGQYAQTEHWLGQRIQLGQEAGVAHVQNPHFVGLAYYERGCLCKDKHEAERLFHLAQGCFEQSYQIHQRWGDENNQAFDVFRIAQALRMQGQASDAHRLREQARQMFSNGTVSGTIALHHIEVEEAKLLIEEGEVQVPQRKLGEVLQAWSRVKYAKGIGDTLKVLGELETMQGNTERALELLVARLIIFPYESHPSTQQVWEEVDHLRQETLRREGRKFYENMTGRIRTLANERQGYFAYLNSVAADRSADAERIFGRL